MAALGWVGRVTGTPGDLACAGLVVSAELTQQVLANFQVVWPSWTASVHAGYARRQCGRVG